jgi:hypothetical protein
MELLLSAGLRPSQLLPSLRDWSVSYVGYRPGLFSAVPIGTIWGEGLECFVNDDAIVVTTRRRWVGSRSVGWSCCGARDLRPLQLVPHLRRSSFLAALSQGSRPGLTFCGPALQASTARLRTDTTFYREMWVEDGVVVERGTYVPHNFCRPYGTALVCPTQDFILGYFQPSLRDH